LANQLIGKLANQLIGKLANQLIGKLKNIPKLHCYIIIFF